MWPVFVVVLVEGEWASRWFSLGVSPSHSCWRSSLTWPLLCRCLVEKGDVAFVKESTVFQNTDGMCLCCHFLPWKKSESLLESHSQSDNWGSLLKNGWLSSFIGIPYIFWILFCLLYVLTISCFSLKGLPLHFLNGVWWTDILMFNVVQLINLSGCCFFRPVKEMFAFNRTENALTGKAMNL